MQSWGIPADKISAIAKQEIPVDLYYKIAEMAEWIIPDTERILYDTIHLPETVNMYYEDHHLYKFSGKIQDIFVNVHDKEHEGKQNIVILDQSAFYPTSGG